jgi:hypothetical protein
MTKNETSPYEFFNRFGNGHSWVYAPPLILSDQDAIDEARSTASFLRDCPEVLRVEVFKNGELLASFETNSKMGTNLSPDVASSDNGDSGGSPATGEE